MKSLNPEVIRAITPMFFGSVGAVIGVVVLVSPGISDTKSTAGLGLAGTAIAGAAGLAQTSKNEQDFSVKKEGENLRVDTPATSSNEKN
ncbi:MAG: hypothetical protein SAK29_01465 [Scytonema sp. PMC 1069.18]|nr:hypothetical protein [Scytonema sp. PMC 1069.18]MEC4883800.1 hypothetical protein [Scytonema sp. PMC 1070.18]